MRVAPRRKTSPTQTFASVRPTVPRFSNPELDCRDRRQGVQSLPRQKNPDDGKGLRKTRKMASMVTKKQEQSRGNLLLSCLRGRFPAKPGSRAAPYYLRNMCGAWQPVQVPGLLG
jgi:hypothetical protein